MWLRGYNVHLYFVQNWFLFSFDFYKKENEGTNNTPPPPPNNTQAKMLFFMLHFNHNNTAKLQKYKSLMFNLRGVQELWQHAALQEQFHECTGTVRVKVHRVQDMTDGIHTGHIRFLQMEANLQRVFYVKNGSKSSMSILCEKQLLATTATYNA